MGIKDKFNFKEVESLDKDILEIAYYFSTFYCNGLGVNEKRLFEILGTKVNLSCFKEAIRLFTYILTTNDLKPLKTSKNILKLNNELKNKTAYQLRKKVLTTIKNF